MVVLSLSTIPSRFNLLTSTLNSLLEQSVPASSIEINIPHKYRRFPEYDGSLPEVPEGITIHRTEEDLGPATKVLPTVKRYEGQDVEIIFVDDDRIFEPDFIKTFLVDRNDHPNDAICGHGFEIEFIGLNGYDRSHQPRRKLRPRLLDFKYTYQRIKQGLREGSLSQSKVTKPARNKYSRSGYADIGEGFCGIMVKPSFFDESVFEIPDVMWSVDDVWLSGHLLKNGHAMWVNKDIFALERPTALQRVDPLYAAVIDGVDRPNANRICAEYMQETYGIWGGKAA